MDVWNERRPVELITFLFDSMVENIKWLSSYWQALEIKSRRRRGLCIVPECDSKAAIFSKIMSVCNRHLDRAYSNALPSFPLGFGSGGESFEEDEDYWIEDKGRLAFDPIWHWFFLGMDAASGNTSRNSAHDLESLKDDSVMEFKPPLRFKNGAGQRKTFLHEEYQ